MSNTCEYISIKICKKKKNIYIYTVHQKLYNKRVFTEYERNITLSKLNIKAKISSDADVEKAYKSYIEQKKNKIYD